MIYNNTRTQIYNNNTIGNLCVGEEFTLKFKDGTTQVNKCLEISELHRTLTWEVSGI